MNWVNYATADSDSSFKPIARRSVAIFLSCALTHNYVRNLAHALALTFAPDLASSLTRIHQFNLTFSPNLADILDDTLERPLSRAFNLDPALARALDLALECEKTKIFKSINFSHLIFQLEALEGQAPDDSQPNEIRREFSTRILQTWYATLNFNPEWNNLSEEEIESFNNYFYANELLVRCKEAAARVSPKTWEAIESRMLTVRA